MNDLIFISDVIYGLKTEYGVSISINRGTATRSLSTGIRNPTITSFNINLALMLPERLRQQFLKQIGIKREGFLESSEQEYIIDRADIPSGKDIIINDWIMDNGIRKDITKTDEYTYAIVVRAKILK